MKPDNRAIADKVRTAIELIEEGSSEQAACERVGIARSTFRQAAVRYGDASYARACEALAKDQVEKLESVVQEMRDGLIAPDVARIEIEARKWISSKLFRPTWGDRTEITGKDGGALQVEARTVTDSRMLSDEQRELLRGVLISALQSTQPQVIEGEVIREEE